MKLKTLALIAVIAVVGVSVAVSRTYHDAAVTWEARAEAAERFSAEKQWEAAKAEQRADSAAAVADSLARSADERGAQRARRVAEVRGVEAPDTCLPFVAPRDTIIDQLVVEVGEWRGAFEAERLASTELRRAVTALEVGNDSLLSVIQTRPSARPWWIPELGAGPGVFVTPAGEVRVGAGIHLSWRLR